MVEATSNKDCCDWCSESLKFDLTSSLLILLTMRNDVNSPPSQSNQGTFCSSVCLQEYLDDYLNPNDSYCN